MEALSGATYEELVDSGVRPVHAKLILSNLGSKSGYGAALPPTVGGASSAEEVNHFLRSVGLENCAAQLAEAGFTSLDRLGEASMQDLQGAGLKAVHARLIVSNLDSVSTVAIAMTPAAQRLASIEADDTLLGGPKKKPRRRIRIVCGVLVVVLLLAYAMRAALGDSAETPPPAIGGAAGADSGVAAATPEEHKGHKGKGGEGKGHKPGGGEGKGEHKGKPKGA